MSGKDEKDYTVVYDADSTLQINAAVNTPYTYTDLVFNTQCGEEPKSISVDELVELPERIKKIEDMLNILNDPDPEILEKYGALRTAFQKYKVLEKLILNPDQIK